MADINAIAEQIQAAAVLAGAPVDVEIRIDWIVHRSSDLDFPCWEVHVGTFCIQLHEQIIAGLK